MDLRPLFLIVFWAVVSPFPCALHAGEVKNAATLYREAADALPREFSIDEKEFLRRTLGLDAIDSVPEQESNLLLQTFASPLSLFEAASRIPACDWENDFSRGYGYSSDPFRTRYNLNRLIVLRMRLHLAKGEIAEALNDLRTALTAAAHSLSPQPTSFELLRRVNAEKTVLNALQADLHRLDPIALEAVSKLLNRPPQWQKIIAVSALDRELFIASIRAELLASPPPDLPWWPRLKAMIGKPFRQVILFLFIRTSDRYHTQFVAQLDAPAPEALAAAQATEKAIQEHPLKMLLTGPAPVYSSALSLLIKHDVRCAMLRTAIAIHLRGPDAVNEIPDPYTGKPFKYESQGDGFTLTSGFSPKDQPLSMTFTP